MSITSRHVFKAAALALVATVAGCGGSGDKAGGDDPGEPLALTYVTQRTEDGATRFAEAVDELSNGSMRIDVREGWRDGEVTYERGTVEDIAAGKADLGDVGVRALDTMGVTSFQALLAPLLIDSVELQRAVAAGDIPTAMLEELAEVGVVGLGVIPGSLRRPAGRKALFGADDYRDRRIGVREGAVAELTLHELGATPVLHSIGDLSTLDGVDLDVERVEGWGHREGVRAVTGNVVLWPKPMAIVVDDDAFAALTTEQQDTLREAASAVIDTVANDVTEREAEFALALCGIDPSFFATRRPLISRACAPHLNPCIGSSKRTPRRDKRSPKSARCVRRSTPSRRRPAPARRSRRRATSRPRRSGRGKSPTRRTSSGNGDCPRRKSPTPLGRGRSWSKTVAGFLATRARR